MKLSSDQLLLRANLKSKCLESFTPRRFMLENLNKGIDLLSH